MDSVRLLTLISALVFAAIGVSSPLVTLYLETLGASYAYISLILATFATVSLFSNYLWGWLSDRLRRRKPVVMAGLIGLALAYVLLSQVSTANWAWVARLLEGISMAAYNTASLALMGDLLAADRLAQRGQRMGTYRGIGSLAFAVGAVVGGPLADHYSLRLTFGLCAALYALAAFITLALPEISSPLEVSPLTPAIVTPPVKKDTHSPMPMLGGQRLPVLFLAGVFLWVTALMASASMWPNFMAKLGYSKTAISSLWGLAALIEAPAMRLLGNLSDVAGRAPLLVVGGVGVALVMLGYVTLARVFPVLIGVQVIRGLAYASYTASAMTFATELGDKRTRGSNSGLFNAVTGGGQLLGLAIGGTLVQARGFEFLFEVCAASALLSGVCFWLLHYQASDLRYQVPD